MKTIIQKKECIKKLLETQSNLFVQQINELNNISEPGYDEFIKKLNSDLSIAHAELIKEILLCSNNDNANNTYQDKMRK